ncbi:hypothetical protein L598_002600000040 [Mesorhizobium sp. J18]|nr:hypothetical protein L598_002600000040 [Mesorhizobium sp. J18]
MAHCPSEESSVADTIDRRLFPNRKGLNSMNMRRSITDNYPWYVILFGLAVMVALTGGWRYYNHQNISPSETMDVK